MKIQALTTLLFLLIAANEAKTMEKCELAKTLKSHGMDGFHGYKLGDWVCMAYHESRYNTNAVGPPNTDGSRDYGIFQINGKYWCADGTYPSKNVCNKSCSSFTNDDITDDIECCKRIVQDPQKMDAWTAWVKHCKGKDISEWTRGCQL
ncbi:PREDICTED: lysozyme C, milk isozyme-like [Gekko japonicus]|uniref:Lysozyme C, milk isozyme-like n=1 Tax=Gekko japonicus TaxID=146911 RepID=A0ABM1JJT4_GEKJA|nr:PREDICTED: lysozyme C, milk isozyme-like [Gekko japonicus]